MTGRKPLIEFDRREDEPNVRFGKKDKYFKTERAVFMDLQQVRGEINEINLKMLELFQKRMECSRQVALYKAEHNMPVLDESREKLIIDKMTELAQTQYKDYAEDFFRGIMSISRSYQSKLLEKNKKAEIIDEIKPENLVYQGVDGSFSSEVCGFYESKSTFCVDTFEEVCLKLVSGEADYGVLPVENSSTGTITEVYDLLLKYNLYIIDEKIIKVDHNLLAPKGVKIQDIKKIYSHPQAFLQCGDYLSMLENVELVPYYNTAISAKSVAQWNDKTKAAIASRKTADLYGLDILQENINSKNENYTKFLVLSPRLEIRSGAGRVCINFTLKHKKGSLLECLKQFAEKGINITKIESRPHPYKTWEYMFFAVFEDNNETDIFKLIGDIGKKTVSISFLGKY